MVASEYSAFVILERSLRWLRGMSVTQILGCNNLLHALRDDIEQGSTYRVRECLALLGLKPLLTAKQIKATMSLSQESDLAFLWFIWEAFYKTSHDLSNERDEYSTNEQLILSAIAHLDMKTTLRALDQILPTAEYSKKYQEIQRAKDMKEAKRKRWLRRRTPPPFVVDKGMSFVERDQMLKKARKRGKTVRTKEKAADDKTLPYLIPQLRPKPYVPMAMMSTPRDRQVIFPRYNDYNDKLHRIPNESRWFATYELSPVKRIIKHCLSAALDPLFSRSRMPLERSTCNVHRMLEFSTARKQQELTIETAKRCLDLLSGNKDEKRRRRIICHLEHDVQAATDKLRQEARTQLAQLQRLIGGPCSVGAGCAMCGKLGFELDFKGRPQRKPDFSFLLDIDFTVSEPPPDVKDKDEPVRVLQMGTENLLRLITPDTVRSLRNTLGSNVYCGQGLKYKGSDRCPPIEGLIKVLNSKGKLEKVVLPRLDMDRCQLAAARETSDASVDRFCSRRTMKNGVLQWDYFKIYKPPEASQSQTQAGEQLDASAIIRSYCIAALKKAMEETKVEIAATVEQQQDGVKDCDERSSRLCAGRDCSSSGKVSVRSCDKSPADGFKHVQSIDPDDVVMLVKLLKIAIDILRKDPQYVLATLPNAHMMPILVDWVAARYGKTYNYRQLENMAKSMDIINNDLTAKMQVPLPNMSVIKKCKTIESYDKYLHSLCHMRQLQSEYHSTLNKAALDASRLIWMAMHGYSNLEGSITDTFFAYLPAKEADFVRHRLWDPNSYRNMVAFRSSR
ncbi:uncharacterized protein LOC132798306 [Drosophila nasuta]|uniref:uncharacterized protein LOC132798306 n=1 Tax=Drosophila nasuta TaxID=42062 RepID=UPI00295EA568|nr:uncharacterized protein LOC132798306 [Drosophila nasuta]